ncbi:hypothetical protein BD311DRAFT_731133 [Dichomitus squalens]|uniref:DUF6593 domain-containing protein n=1 Tax=Dichomitus squalens TaxID=114155 RepID=A0A4Q9M8T2_9APHY|nr:hypothetical protein BD311DRAFT_731133 [Dichomitus squalens]
MDISFVSTDPFNTEVIDSATGNLLYDIETPFKLLRKRTTTIWTARKKVVGLYERSWGHNRVAYLGETRKVAEWLPKESPMSSSRTFVAPNQKVYTWTLASGGTFKLFDAATQAAVAETRYTSAGTRSRKPHISINIGAELVPFLDAVLLAFLICEDERRDIDQQATDAGPPLVQDTGFNGHVASDTGLEASVVANAGLSDVNVVEQTEAHVNVGTKAVFDAGAHGGGGAGADSGQESSLGDGGNDGGVMANAADHGGAWGDTGGYGGDAGGGE